MKVLAVCSGNAARGISPLVKAQVDTLILQGITIDVFSIDEPGFLGYISSIPRLRKRAREYKADIIHAHYGLSGLVTFLSFTGCKVIISFMGDDLIGSVGNHKNYTIFSKILVLLNKLLAKFYYDFSIVKSKELNKIISKVKNKEILPNGVNLKIFYPQDMNICREYLGIDKNEKVVLFASDPERPEKNFSLSQTAIYLSDINNIKILPVYSEEQSELCYYYNAADVLLLTSLHEGSPNVIKEAMACCCPIVATNVGDVAEVLKDTSGCYITEFNPRSVVQNLNMAIEFRRLKGITNGREKIKEMNLDSVTVASKLAGIYNKIYSKQINQI